MFNEQQSYNPEERFGNEDEIQRILATGTEEERRELQEYHHVPQDVFERFTHFASLRHGIHEEMRLNIERRRRENPEKSAEELDMGIYWEEIEPQVQDAVRVMAAKGYKTRGSGFWGPYGTQSIYFSGDELAGVLLPQEFVERMREREIKVVCEPRVLSFEPSRKMDLEELKEIWDEIVEQMPSKK